MKTYECICLYVCIYIVIYASRIDRCLCYNIYIYTHVYSYIYTCYCSSISVIIIVPPTVMWFPHRRGPTAESEFCSCRPTDGAGGTDRVAGAARALRCSGRVIYIYTYIRETN